MNGIFIGFCGGLSPECGKSITHRFWEMIHGLPIDVGIRDSLGIAHIWDILGIVCGMEISGLVG